MFYFEGRNKSFFAPFLAVVLLSGCAVVKPPSGGPEDKTPPRLVSIKPAPDSTGVGRSVVVSMDFSEDIDLSSFKKKVDIYPPVQIKKLRAKGNRLFMEFADELPETTFSVIVRPGFRDYHGVESKEKHVFYFSTSDSMEKGSISGRVFFKKKPDSSAVVKLFEAKGDSLVDFLKAKELRTTFTGFDGSYVFKALPTDGAGYKVFAFTDRNGNGRFEKDKEFASTFRDTVVLTDSSPEFSGADVYIIDPNEPAELAGRVLNESGFDVMPLLVLSPILPGEKAAYRYAGETGEFKFSKVKPGLYLLEVIADVKPDSVCGTFVNPSDTTEVIKEPCIVLPDTLRLGPGEKVELPVIKISGEGRLK